jgi:hypothetical protein
VSSVIFILLEYDVCVTGTKFPICEITVLNFEFVVCRPVQCVNFRVVIRRYDMMNYYCVGGWEKKI